MSRAERKSQIIDHIILVVFSVIAILPFLLMLASSFSSESSLLNYGYGFWPREGSTEAYRYLASNADVIMRSYGITILVTVAGTSVGVLFTICLAYPLSMPDMPLRRLISFLIYFTMLFNGGVVSTYIMYSRYLGIRNTLWALLIPNLLVNAFQIILARSFFQSSIPGEILESARVDGSGEFRILVQIVFPMTKPILATLVLIKGLSYWNDWTNGLYYVNDSSLYSIQQLLNTMLQNIKAIQSSTNLAEGANALSHMPTTATRMAIAVISILPIVIVYPFLQKYFIKGITIGAVKG